MGRKESEPRTREELITALENMRRNFEYADGIENSIERTSRLEQLWEQTGLLEAEIADTDDRN